MTAVQVAERPLSGSDAVATVRDLARAEAGRFSRHPLFLLGTAVALVMAVPVVRTRDPDPLAVTILPAFFVGVFGFVVAHRLTTSLQRAAELVGSTPSSQRTRTTALCLACLVPLVAGVLITVECLVLTAVDPPDVVPAGGPMAWFGDYSWPVVVSALLAMGPVACLGGPLLGVAVARWAPFRGSALLGVVLLVVACSTMASGPQFPWRAMPPWAALSDERVEGGVILSSTFPSAVSPVWYLAYTLLLCALAVVAALLRDPRGRRPLLWTGAVLSVATVGAFVLAVT